MIKEGKFGVQEAVCLATITVSSKVFFTSPAFLSRYVGTAVWYTTLISNLVAILAFTFIYQLLKRFPGKNLYEAFEGSVGRICGFIFSLAFLMSFIQSLGALFREFTDVLRVFSYPNTSSGIIVLVLILLVILAAFLGLESMARVSKLFAYLLFFGGGVLVVLLSLPNMNVNYLFPILGHGLNETLIHGIRRSSAYGEITIIAVFAASLHGIKEIKKIGYAALVLSGIIYVVTLLAFNLIFPYYSLEEITAPFFEMTRLIKFGTFFQRLDPVFLFIWCMSAFICISVLFYAALTTFCYMFRLQDKRPIIIPMAVLLFALTLAPRDFSSIVYGSVQQLRENGWIIFYVLPFIALITAIIRKKKGEQPNA